jgi:nicotinate phosphoribosyltransferase
MKPYELPVFTTLLDNDFYKFTMQQAVVKLFPNTKAKYSFINRGKHSFPEGFDLALRACIEKMDELKMSAEEKLFLKNNCPYLDPTYLDFLQGYRYDPSEVNIQQVGDTISVAVEGYWYRTILWEVPIMSLICELYYKMTNTSRIEDTLVQDNTINKIEKYKKLGVTIAEFGSRRRYSYDVQNLVVKALKKSGGTSFIGTSNVHFAIESNTKPIGTHAHEWFMFHGAKYGFKMANAMGLENWTQVYQGDLGIALTDTFTTDVFLKQFNKKFSKLFDGVRHDSGNPFEFADKIVSHYSAMGINPLSKTIIFSDGLNYDKVEKIVSYCKGRIGVSFGIGTNFTNDVGPKPMNIVIKMTEITDDNKNWIAVVKLSDEEMKHTGTPKMITLAKTILDL